VFTRPTGAQTFIASHIADPALPIGYVKATNSPPRVAAQDLVRYAKRALVGAQRERTPNQGSSRGSAVPEDEDLTRLASLEALQDRWNVRGQRERVRRIQRDLLSPIELQRVVGSGAAKCIPQAQIAQVRSRANVYDQRIPIEVQFE